MVVVGPLEVRQQGLEGGHRQAGQLLEDSGSKAELLEVQHARAPRSRRKGIAYSKDDLIPIKSTGYERPGGGSVHQRGVGLAGWAFDHAWQANPKGDEG